MDEKEIFTKAWEQSIQTTTRGKNKGETRQGSSVRVAEQLGVPVEFARERLVEYGLMPKRVNYKDTIGQLKELYESGLTVYQAGERVGVNSDTASRWLKKAGVEVTPSQHRRTPEEQEGIKSRISQTRSDPLHQEKIRLRNREKYGSDWPKQSHLPASTLEAFSSPESLKAYIEQSGLRNAVALAKEMGCGYSTLEVWAKRYGVWSLLNHPTVSSYEHEISSLVKSWGFEVETSDRTILKPQEIDIYIPSKKLGIEFNGDYWHSELHKTQNYHQKKSLLAREQGVQLFHIFEYEWRDESKRPAIIGQLRNLLDVDMERVYGRNTRVVELDPSTKSQFLRENHRQGNDRASVRLGLEHNGRVVAVMTFGRARFTQKYEWELSRFCSLQGVRVVGGASKLFKYFVKNYSPSSIVSYADIAKTRGELYERLGFTLSHISSPNYVWTDLLQVLTRYQTQMKNERETMQDAGFFRVFDCGSQVWTWST